MQPWWAWDFFFLIWIFFNYSKLLTCSECVYAQNKKNCYSQLFAFNFLPFSFIWIHVCKINEWKCISGNRNRVNLRCSLHYCKRINIPHPAAAASSRCEWARQSRAGERGADRRLAWILPLSLPWELHQWGKRCCWEEYQRVEISNE